MWSLKKANPCLEYKHVRQGEQDKEKQSRARQGAKELIDTLPTIPYLEQ